MGSKYCFTTIYVWILRAKHLHLATNIMFFLPILQLQIIKVILIVHHLQAVKILFSNAEYVSSHKLKTILEWTKFGKEKLPVYKINKNRETFIWCIPCVSLLIEFHAENHCCGWTVITTIKEMRKRNRNESRAPLWTIKDDLHYYCTFIGWQYNGSSTSGVRFTFAANNWQHYLQKFRTAIFHICA